MIKPIEEILRNIVYVAATDIELQKLVLKNWANDIIQECANNFECTMESGGSNSDNEDEHYITAGSGEEVHPVLVRQYILEVKNKIK